MLRWPLQLAVVHDGSPGQVASAPHLMHAACSQAGAAASVTVKVVFEPRGVGWLSPPSVTNGGCWQVVAPPQSVSELQAVNFFPAVVAF